MKFLIDAQLPRQLCTLLDGAGHDSIHTSVLPEGNRTGDRQIAETADREDRVVVTKDRDFRDSHLLRVAHAVFSSSSPATSPTTIYSTCSSTTSP